MAVMECPRCGFVQPKDRYCANCGLDSENYQPKPVPVTQRLLKSPLLYVGGAAVLVVALAMFFVRAPSPDRATNADSFVVEGDVAPYDSATEANDSASAAVTETQAPPQEARLRGEPTPAAQPPPTPPAPTSVSAADATQATASAEVPAESPAQPVAPATPTQIQIQFYEFPRAALAMAGSQSQVVSEGDQYRILLHSEPEALADWLRRGRRLPGSRSTTIREGATLSTNFEADSATGNTLGRLAFDAIINRVSPLGLVLEVRGVYNSAAANAVRFNATPTMTADSSLLIFGVITHVEEGTEDFPSQPNSPLSILESADFQDKLSEFVTVIQLR